MSNSSPAARPTRASPGSRLSYHSPVRPELSEFLLESRNSPEAHKRAFDEAQREHDRVLKAALHVFELHQIAEQTRRIEEENKQRQEKAKAEAKRIEDERRAEAQRLQYEAQLQALKAKPIPKPTPPPVPVTPVEKTPLPNGLSSIPQPSAVPNGPTAAKPPVSTAGQTAAARPLFGALPTGTSAAAAATSVTTTTAFPTQQGSRLPPLASQAEPAKPAVPAANGVMTGPTQGTGSTAPPLSAPAPDRYVQIHKKLKELRAFMTQQAKDNPSIKNTMGDMRREIRKSIGQLTSGGLKENRIPVENIMKTLRQSLQAVPSVMIDPAEFVLEPRQPVGGAANNDKLPSLFLYLMNILAKAVISQFINESGADARTADSIGRVATKVFSSEELLWRGKPLIDIVMAKYRVVCPVLFGFRGNDKMEQGRARVGWKKDGGHWISEQEHSDRMTGLGAGFAAMTLRDFSKAKQKHPWPPTAYWTAMARILSTPPDQTSKTQCLVLKAMIAGYEKNFIHFYGNAAVAALKCALIDFPAKVPEQSSASSALKVQAKTLAMNTGLRLDQM